MDLQPPLALEPPDSGDDEPQGREPWLRFAVIFGVLAIGSEVLYYAVVLESAGFQAYLRVLADISVAFLALFDGDVTVHGTRIASSAFSVEVAEGCDAIQVCSLLAAAVIAFPIGFKRKLRGLGIGILWLQFLNLARIVTLFWIGEHFPSIFKKSHEVVWPGILITITVVIWVLWVRWETRAPDSPEHAA